MTDPIADMLTRIRNANSLYRPQVEIPYSKLKDKIAQKLKVQGFIKDYEMTGTPPHHSIKLYLKYGPNGEKVIREIIRVSTPGRRVYRGTKEMKRILNGLGIAILSTPKGVLTDAECRQQKIGGEVLCTVW